MISIRTVVAALLTVVSLTAQAEIAVIVHPANALTSISAMDLTRIYLGRMKTFPGSSDSAVPLNLAEDDPARSYLESEMLHKSPTQMKSYWTKLMFTGEGKPPEEVADAAAAIARVAKDKSAIACVDPAAVTGDVKVVPVQ